MRFTWIWLLASFCLHAQAQVPVEVEHTGRDSVGQRLAYYVKESLRASRGLELTTDESIVRMQLSIVTLEGNRDSPGSYTVYSASWLWTNPKNLFPFYLTSSVGYCGTQRARECAEDLVAKTNTQAEEIQKLIRQATRN